MTREGRNLARNRSPGRAAAKSGSTARFRALAAEIARVGKNFYDRGWVLGTSGNFSAVVSQEPLRLAITPSGLDKGALSPAQVLEIDDAARVTRGRGKPSDETRIHLAVVRVRGAGAVLHTHSAWSTIVSETFAHDAGVNLEGYEMLKGLEGVHTHEHREWLPILDNSQDIARIAQLAEAALEQHPGAHGFLLRGHGLYTWGENLSQAKRHVEILEFLLEVCGRTRATRS